jgi:hypothetical protein
MRKCKVIKKLSALRTDEYFRMRAASCDVAKAKRPGDEIE